METKLELEQIVVPERQQRRQFDDHGLDQLAMSVERYGILQPLLVRPLSEGRYELIAGERRYRAATQVGMKQVPVVVKEMTDTQAKEAALLENLQREDLNPIDETDAILGIMTIRLECSVEEVISLLYRMQHEAKGQIKNSSSDESAQTGLGRSKAAVEDLFKDLGLMSWHSFVTSRLPLLNLQSDCLEAVRGGRIAYSKALEIAKIKDNTERKNLLHLAVNGFWNRDRVKEEVKKLKSGASSKAANLDDSPVSKESMLSSTQNASTRNKQATPNERGNSLKKTDGNGIPGAASRDDLPGARHFEEPEENVVCSPETESQSAPIGVVTKQPVMVELGRTVDGIALTQSTIRPDNVPEHLPDNGRRQRNGNGHQSGNGDEPSPVTIINMEPVVINSSLRAIENRLTAIQDKMKSPDNQDQLPQLVSSEVEAILKQLRVLLRHVVTA